MEHKSNISDLQGTANPHYVMVMLDSRQSNKERIKSRLMEVHPVHQGKV